VKERVESKMMPRFLASRQGEGRGPIEGGQREGGKEGAGVPMRRISVLLALRQRSLAAHHVWIAVRQSGMREEEGEEGEGSLKES
jgi:hypothetical protein